jgi:hypothetical protein
MNYQGFQNNQVNLYECFFLGIKLTKCKLYKTLLRPIILYGSESWALMKTEENKLKVFENMLDKGLL